MVTPLDFIKMTDEQVAQAARRLARADGHTSAPHYNAYFKKQYEAEIRRFASIAVCIMEVVDNAENQPHQ